MNKSASLLAGAAMLGFGAAAYAQDEPQAHPCGDIQTTTDVTQCLEATISAEKLGAYMDMSYNNPYASALYTEVDNTNEGCINVNRIARPLTFVSQYSYAYPDTDLSSLFSEDPKPLMKAFFENAAICYQAVLDEYDAAGFEEHKAFLPDIVEAMQGSADAIMLD